MDLITLRAELEAEEGRECVAYPDPLTRAEPWTIGVGHTGPEVRPGLVWTDAQIDAALDSDIQKAMEGLDRIAPWWRGVDTVRQNVLIDMCFNMGPKRLFGFHKMLAACAVGDWVTAAAEMIDSSWHHETGTRAVALERRMMSGEF